MSCENVPKFMFGVVNGCEALGPCEYYIAGEFIGSCPRSKKGQTIKVLVDAFIIDGCSLLLEETDAELASKK
jgi:hypothetical protein